MAKQVFCNKSGLNIYNLKVFEGGLGETPHSDREKYDKVSYKKQSTVSKYSAKGSKFRILLAEDNVINQKVAFKLSKSLVTKQQKPYER